ncbi:hypothetical protein V5799_007477 [Amblyomma americanum]|uniref:Uncharacterized protein n=1 Tax=Amblyomma americanum TaxID=6943 RepID=A0AAQ4DK04_AMBAM
MQVLATAPSQEAVAKALARASTQEAEAQALVKPSTREAAVQALPAANAQEPVAAHVAVPAPYSGPAPAAFSWSTAPPREAMSDEQHQSQHDQTWRRASEIDSAPESQSTLVRIPRQSRSGVYNLEGSDCEIALKIEMVFA